MIELLNQVFTNRPLIKFDRELSTSPLNYIHPYKVPIVQNILKIVPPCVESIIVYGSSIEDYQNENSDIDLAVIPYDDDYTFAKAIKKLNLPIKVDIKMFNSFEELIEQANDYFPTPRDIVLKGIPIYAKGLQIKVEV